MAQTAAGILAEALEQAGVTQIFALIGDSLNPLAGAVMYTKIEWVGVWHEEGGALARAFGHAARGVFKHVPPRSIAGGRGR
jgi:pyruvate dehydrogenase (quinone)